MPACLRCRTLVETKVLLYVLCCSVKGRLKAVLLCLGYVRDNVAFGAWFVPFVVCAEEKAGSKAKTSRLFAFFGGHIYA